jgi:Flp pilus assembly protein TadD
MNNQNYFNASSSKVNIDRTNSLFYNIRGVSQADNRNYRVALELFTKAIELNPKDPVVFFNKASIEMHLGLFKEARKDFEESEKLHVNNGYE